MTVNHLNHRTGQPFPRGARATPRHLLAHAHPFRAAAAPPPFFFIFPLKMSMWLNDTYGCCVTSEEAFNKACNGVFIEDHTVLAWANANGVLNGANLQPVVQQMQASGFSQDTNIYGDGNGLAVNYADAPTMQVAIYAAGQQGGCIKLGVAANELPSGAGNVNGWFMTNNSPDQNEDHCMGCSGYGTAQQFVTAMNAAYQGLGLALPSGVDPNMQGYAVYTWSTIGFASVQALINFCGEAWIRNPSSANTGTGKPDPDIVYVTGGPTPPPPPPPPPAGNMLMLASALAPGSYPVAGIGSLVLTSLGAVGNYPVGTIPPPPPPPPPTGGLTPAERQKLQAALTVLPDLTSTIQQVLADNPQKGK